MGRHPKQGTGTTFSTWDGLGRLTEAKNNDSTVQRTWDTLSRMETETQGRNPISTWGPRGLTNVTAITADMNDFAPDGCFDRVVSVEMFVHMRNWDELLCRVSSWLGPEGKLFGYAGGGEWFVCHTLLTAR